MNVTVIDLEGEATKHDNIDRVAFSNAETFGNPVALQPQDRDERLLLVNANGYSHILLKGD